MIAIDLNSQLFWWDSDAGIWELIPELEYKKLFGQIQAWRSVGWQAVHYLRQFFDKGHNDPEGSAAYERFFAIQDTLMRVQEFQCPWQRGWLYRSLCLDHRWLLHEIEPPMFDEFIFSILLLGKPGTPLDEERVHWLQKDPIISAMPALHDLIYPDSWKTKLMLNLRTRGLNASIDDINTAIDRLVASGLFTEEQAEALRLWRKPLVGTVAEIAGQSVIEEVTTLLLDSSAVVEARHYQHFRLPTLDQALFIYPPTRP